MVNTAELRQIFPLRENTLRHVVEGDGRYPRAMTPSAKVVARTRRKRTEDIKLTHTGVT